MVTKAITAPSPPVRPTSSCATGQIGGQQAYLKASNTEGPIAGEFFGDSFGRSVAVCDDTVVIGAYAEDSSAAGVNGNQSDNAAGNSGAAYIFVRSGTNWNQQAYLKASNTGADDMFGFSVAVAGDTVVDEDSNATSVNDNQSDDSVPGSGAAYIFTGLGPPPRLSIERAAANVRVFWALPATGYLLEEVNTLDASPVTGWTQVPFPYETNATHISVTVPMPMGSRFYRLHKP